MTLIYIWQPTRANWHLLLLIPGFALMVVNFVWISIIIGVLGTRFRDLPPIIANLLQVLFFLTPVMYPAEALPPHLSLIFKLNPFYYLIEAVRAPLLGIAPTVDVYAILVFCAASGSFLSFRLFTRVRARISYWL